MKRVMRESISGVIAVFKGVLRLYKIKAPAKKMDIIAAMPAAMKLDKKVFSDILLLKQGKDVIRDAPKVFYEYVEGIERVVEKVDKL
jgi:hypothetical protein